MRSAARNRELSEALMGPQPGGSKRDPSLARAAAERAGLVVTDLRQERPLTAFYDIGATWNQDVSGRESAATAGLGVAAQAGRYSGYLELAKPLTRPDLEGRRSATVFGGLSVRL